MDALFQISSSTIAKMTMEYSAGLTSKLFWLQEARKTASNIVDGLSKPEIRTIAWEENVRKLTGNHSW